LKNVSKAWKIGACEFNARSYRLRKENSDERLGTNEAKLLEFLIRHFRKPVKTNQEIIDAVWPEGKDQGKDDLHKSVQKLRQALGGNREDYITTGRPYRLVQEPIPIKWYDNTSALQTVSPATGSDHSNAVPSSSGTAMPLPNYDVAFADLVIRSKDKRISAYPGFGWGTALSLQDAPDYAGWPGSEINISYKRDKPFQLSGDKQRLYQTYFSDFYQQKNFHDNDDKFMLERNPTAFSDAPSLLLTVRRCKYSEIQFYRDHVANTPEGDGLLADLINGSLYARFPHSLCLHMVVITADGKLLLTKRSPKVGYYPNAWSSSVEEQLATSDLIQNERIRFLEWTKRLLAEELHVHAGGTRPGGTYLASVFVESAILNISMCAETTINLTESQLNTILQGHRRKDTEFVDWKFLDLSRAALLKAIIHPGCEYHPTSGYRLVQTFLKYFDVPSEAEISRARAA
jgi:DNA-binding winged helix-turn-helix (wHTH) protein